MPAPKHYTQFPRIAEYERIVSALRNGAEEFKLETTMWEAKEVQRDFYAWRKRIEEATISKRGIDVDLYAIDIWPQLQVLTTRIEPTPRQDIRRKENPEEYAREMEKKATLFIFPVGYRKKTNLLEAVEELEKQVPAFGQ